MQQHDFDSLHASSARLREAVSSEPSQGTVLTVRPPVDGVWQLSLTRDGEVMRISDIGRRVHRYDGRLAALIGALTIEEDSDGYAAAEHAVDLLADDFEVRVDYIERHRGGFCPVERYDAQ